jgi:hypothetical protein
MNKFKPLKPVNEWEWIRRNNCEVSNKEEVLEGTNSPTVLILCNNKVSIALFNYGKLSRTLVSMLTLLTMVTVVKQWVHLWVPFLHKYGLNYYTKMGWLPWLPNLILHGGTLNGASLASTSEVPTSSKSLNYSKTLQ